MPTKYVVTEFKDGKGTPIYETMVLEEARDMVLNQIRRKSRTLLIIREEGFPSSMQRWV